VQNDTISARFLEGPFFVLKFLQTLGVSESGIKARSNKNTQGLGMYMGGCDSVVEHMLYIHLHNPNQKEEKKNILGEYWKMPLTYNKVNLT
jgi:hypothetical protein